MSYLSADPEGGTPLVVASPPVALDLPLEARIRQDQAGLALPDAAGPRLGESYQH